MVKPWEPLQDMPDLEGKVAVVTGANSGIGLSTVKFLLLRGAKVYFTARSEAKAKSTVKELLEASPEIKEGRMVWLPLDLADLKSVNSAIEELKRKETKVDILINNAGIASASTETVGDGWEVDMAVNHVGHFVFTNGVLPLLKAATAQKGADVRIVTLSSNVNTVMLPSNYQFNFSSPSFLANPVPYYPWQWRYLSRHVFVVDMIRYAVTKVANLLFAQELQRILDKQGVPIISTSVHPGGVGTDGAYGIGNTLFQSVARNFFLTIDQGAATSLFAATAKEVRGSPDKYKGRYLEPFGNVGIPHVVTKDEVQVRGLWENTTTEVNKYLTKLGLPLLQEW